MSTAQQLAQLTQRIIDLEEEVRILKDQRTIGGGSGALDITTAVRDSSGRVGSLADYFYVDSDNLLKAQVVDASFEGAAKLCRITGGSAGAWSVRAVAANGDLYGDTYSNVTVPSGHNDSGALAVGDYIVCVFAPATGSDDTPTPKIVNYFFIDTTP